MVALSFNLQKIFQICDERELKIPEPNIARHAMQLPQLKYGITVTLSPGENSAASPSTNFAAISCPRILG